MSKSDFSLKQGHHWQSHQSHTQAAWVDSWATRYVRSKKYEVFFGAVCKRLRSETKKFKICSRGMIKTLKTCSLSPGRRVKAGWTRSPNNAKPCHPTYLSWQADLMSRQSIMYVLDWHGTKAVLPDGFAQRAFVHTRLWLPQQFALAWVAPVFWSTHELFLPCFLCARSRRLGSRRYLTILWRHLHLFEWLSLPFWPNWRSIILKCPY